MRIKVNDGSIRKSVMAGGGGGIIILLILFSSCTQVWQDKYDYDEFIMNNRKCIVVKPNVAPNGKWIVRPAFIGMSPYVDDSMLCRGYTFAYYDVTHEYANPKAQSDFNDFYEYVRLRYKLSDKFVMEGLSRGGFFALVYAINHPEQIDNIYVFAPVCDLRSWPMKQNSKLYHDADSIWRTYGYAIDSISDYPIKAIDTLINHDIPIICVYGDQDTVVPYKDNFGRIKLPQNDKYKVIKKKNCGHHPISLEESEEIVNFIINQ